MSKLVRLIEFYLILDNLLNCDLVGKVCCEDIYAQNVCFVLFMGSAAKATVIIAGRLDY